MAIVIPSYLEREMTNFSEFVNNNISLKIGTVIDLVLPKKGTVNEDGTENPASPPFPLYTVLVKEKQNGVLVSIPYNNCVLKDLFGSIPDFFEYSLRRSNFSSDSSSSTSDSSNNKSGSLSQLQKTTQPPADSLLGANVLIQCINGSTFNAVILGAVRTFNPNYDYGQGYNTVTNKTGKYLSFAFNGILININDDGELNVSRIGPQSNKGNTLLKDANDNEYESNQAGSLFSINKKGDIQISAGTNEASDNQNTKYTPQILLEKTGKITIASGQNNDSADLPNNSVTIKPDGSIEIIIDNGDNLQLSGKIDDAQLTLGSGAKSATVAEPLQQLYQQLFNFLSTLTVSTAMGPSSVPINLAQLPNWDQNIISQSMKIPK